MNKLNLIHKLIVSFTIILTATLGLTSCTNNSWSRQFGGDQHLTLPANHELVNVTWKGDDMWILTKDTLTNICSFHEKSSYGLLEGNITFTPAGQ